MERIDSAVGMFFASLAVTTIGTVVQSLGWIVGRVEQMAAFASLTGLVGGVLALIAVFRLRRENRCFAKSLRALWICLGCLIGAVILTVALFGASGNWGLPEFLMLGAVIVIGVMAVRFRYLIYAGFETLREERGIAYSPRRIIWCFWLELMAITLNSGYTSWNESLFAIDFSGSVGAADALAFSIFAAGAPMLLAAMEAIRLWVMYGYRKAIRLAAEEASARGGMYF